MNRPCWKVLKGAKCRALFRPFRRLRVFCATHNLRALTQSTVNRITPKYKDRREKSWLCANPPYTLLSNSIRVLAAAVENRIHYIELDTSWRLNQSATTTLALFYFLTQQTSNPLLMMASKALHMLRRQGGTQRMLLRPLHRVQPTSPCLYGYSAGKGQNRNDSTGGAQRDPKNRPASARPFAFWRCKSTWQRAAVNTTRCLVGCTLGDFSAMWSLQAFYPELGLGTIMAISSKSYWNSATSSAFADGLTLNSG